MLLKGRYERQGFGGRDKSNWHKGLLEAAERATLQ